MLTQEAMLTLAAELTGAQAHGDAASLAAIAWQLYGQWARTSPRSPGCGRPSMPRGTGRRKRRHQHQRQPERHRWRRAPPQAAGDLAGQNGKPARRRHKERDPRRRSSDSTTPSGACC